MWQTSFRCLDKNVSKWVKHERLLFGDEMFSFHGSKPCGRGTCLFSLLNCTRKYCTIPLLCALGAE